MTSTAYGIAQCFLLLGVFLKQFYISSSGGFQIGDACLMASFIVLIAFHCTAHIYFEKFDKKFIIFVGLIFVINGIYFLYYGNDYPGEFRFHKSIIYYVYNLFVVLTFRQFCDDEEFMDKLRKTFQLGLAVQFIIALLGFGRSASGRYTGTFNDPNQCAFYVFAAFLFIYTISAASKKGRPLIWYLIMLFLVIKTVSTGMMLGIFVFTVWYIFSRLMQKNKKTAGIFLTAVFTMILLLTLLDFGAISVPAFISGNFMYSRIVRKINSIGVFTAENSGSIRYLFVDRCWDRLLDYPWKMILGAGEGYFMRFPSARYHYNEIHSSILGPLFYYGILPCLLMLSWIKSNVQGIRKELWAVYIALIAESMTLVNNRQPMFWMLFVMAGSMLMKKQEAQGKDSNLNTLHNI